MDLLTGILGALTLILGLVLSAIAFGNRIVKGIKAQVREVLVETGLVRPGLLTNDWPNGWHNLPDTLDGIYAEMVEHEHQTQNGH